MMILVSINERIFEIDKMAAYTMLDYFMEQFSFI